MNAFRSFISVAGSQTSALPLLAAMCLFSACDKPKPVTLTLPVLPPRTVSAATVTTRDVPQFLEAQGQTTAFQSVMVVSQVDGEIIDLPFQQGAMVKKGDKIAQIFPDLFDAAVKKAEGQVASDTANLKLAQDTADRNKLLLPDKQISEQQYDTFVAQVEALKGQLEVDQALLKTAQINLDYTNITAPIDGMVGTYRINAGNVIKANDLPITTIQTMSPIYVDFSISESDFPLVRKFFDTNGGTLKVHVTSLSDSKAQQDGKLTILGNAVAAPTGTVSLRATLPNDNRLFWPNQPVDVRILLDTLKDSVVVPESAVLMSQQGEFVFVADAAAKSGDMPTAEMRVVQTGQTQDDGMKVITSGLKPGEQVVVVGQVFLAPTMPLIISELDG
ncbi:MAG TPA: efflux RND transporter periplasmic adaptor subunit, partial [Opitutales bacterium]|nr:efflux RND transporter periplasmic adaptor subunit [Opitutales bacterium]